MTNDRQPVSDFVRLLLPNAGADALTFAEETMDRFYAAIFDVCEEVRAERLKDTRDKSERYVTLCTPEA